ncbi:transcriptional repressor [Sorochytrium milnesiophthora]
MALSITNADGVRVSLLNDDFTSSHNNHHSSHASMPAAHSSPTWPSSLPHNHYYPVLHSPPPPQPPPLQQPQTPLPLPTPTTELCHDPAAAPTMPSPTTPLFGQMLDAKNAKKKRFVCSYDGCNRAFGSSGHLNRHEKTVHMKEKPFECPLPDCQARFSRNDNRWQHYRTHFAPRRSFKSAGQAALSSPDDALSLHDSPALSASSSSASSMHDLPHEYLIATPLAAASSIAERRTKRKSSAPALPSTSVAAVGASYSSSIAAPPLIQQRPRSQSHAVTPTWRAAASNTVMSPALSDHSASATSPSFMASPHPSPALSDVEEDARTLLSLYDGYTNGHNIVAPAGTPSSATSPLRRPQQPGDVLQHDTLVQH